MSKVDAETVTLQSKDRIVAGVAQADIPPTMLKRQPPEKSNSRRKAQNQREEALRKVGGLVQLSQTRCGRESGHRSLPTVHEFS